MAGCSGEKDKKKTITVSAAASLSDVLKETAEAYQKEHKNEKIVFNFGGSGALSQQIINGAPVDLFISAAKDPVDLIKDKGLTENEIALFKNKLVLIVPKDVENEQIDFSNLDKGSVKKIAIGTPEAVPAGTYAKETLESLNKWGSLKEKLVYCKDVRQVLQYVESNNVDAGMVYYTDAITSKKVKVVSEAAESWHQPIVYYTSIISDGKNQDEASDFLEFMKSEKAKSIFERFGFSY
ncbi:molybdate ABC transporter substrate-binding protein [Falsibacillus pallidus]|uniref:molybdate ABC transporter substrate-binding protein n=1 Tax=Falsibacillus pallidus TaxID=493781 RepID=UPI003D980A8D